MFLVSLQPLESTYVITEFPALIPEIKPLESTVTLLVEEVQGFATAAVPLPVNCIVDPKHKFDEPNY
jgi:hypothetical protein